jgi:hypothetical protein
MGRECVGPASAVRLGRPVESTFTHLFVRADRFGQRVVVWVSPLEMPLPKEAHQGRKKGGGLGPWPRLARVRVLGGPARPHLP